MTKRLAGLIVALLCLALTPAASAAAAGKSLKPFASDAELSQLLAKWKGKALHRRESYGVMAGNAAPSPVITEEPSPMAPPPPPAQMAASAPMG